MRKTNTALPGASTSSKPYGLAPIFKQICSTITRAGSQALVLATLAENSLPFTMAPVVINLAKDLSRDPQALSKLSMDRTSASYKMRYGLAKTYNDKTLDNIKNSFFSLNIDESTSNNLMRVLTILVSYFSATEQSIVVEHLSSLSCIHATSAAVF